MNNTKKTFDVDIENLRYNNYTAAMKCKEESFGEMKKWWKQHFPNNTRIIKNNHVSISEWLFLEGTLDELLIIRDKLVGMDEMAFRVELEKVVKKIEEITNSWENVQRW